MKLIFTLHLFIARNSNLKSNFVQTTKLGNKRKQFS